MMQHRIAAATCGLALGLLVLGLAGQVLAESATGIAAPFSGCIEYCQRGQQVTFGVEAPYGQWDTISFYVVADLPEGVGLVLTPGIVNLRGGGRFHRSVRPNLPCAATISLYVFNGPNGRNSNLLGNAFSYNVEVR